MPVLEPPWILPGIFILGTIAGSFLSVVVARLPGMLAASEPERTLWHPPSSCPHCRRRLRPQQLIPLLGFLALRGRCGFCAQPISRLYPALELGAGLIAVVVWTQAPTPAGALIAATAGWTLLALAAIDLRARLLPDALVFPLLWLGLLANAAGFLVPVMHAIWGVVAGYGALWTVRRIHLACTGTEGLGLGDCKLFAACGAWVGWTQLSWVLLLACALTAAGWLACRLCAPAPLRLAFGPGLCAALALVALHTGSRL